MTEGVLWRDVERLTMDACACGGRGPGEGCVVCDLYHALKAHRVVFVEAWSNAPQHGADATGGE